MYGNAKRPRERAANRLSCPDTPIGETKPIFAVALDSRLVVGAPRQKRWQPGRGLKNATSERPQVKLRQTPVRRNEAKFLNDYMDGWSSLMKTVADRVCA